MEFAYKLVPYSPGYKLLNKHPSGNPSLPLWRDIVKGKQINSFFKKLTLFSENSGLSLLQPHWLLVSTPSGGQYLRLKTLIAPVALCTTDFYRSHKTAATESKP